MRAPFALHRPTCDNQPCRRKAYFHMNWGGARVDGETHMFVCKRCLTPTILLAQRDAYSGSVVVDREMVLPYDSQRFIRPKKPQNP